MNILILDFETHYEPRGDYSLSKMPTAQYIRDPRFEVLGCAVQRIGAKDYGLAWIKPRMVGELFALVDWQRTIAVAHNAQFDGAILAWKYGRYPARWLCTQQWTRYAIAQGVLPPDAKTRLAWWGEFLGVRKGDTAAAVDAGGDALAAYGVRDVEITAQVLRWLAEHAPLPALERDFIDLHVRMHTEPRLALDKPLLTTLANPEPNPAAEKLRSREVFASALVACGVTPGTKTSPANGKTTYAFAKSDAFMRGLAAHPDPRVRLLHQLKTEGASTIVASRAQRLLDAGEPLAVPLLYYGAHTGRSSGLDKLNLQNLPRGEFRKALVAPPGQRIIAADYSQIEARVVAWGSGDPAALEVFESGRDPYKVTASRDLYGVPYDEVTPEQRQRAKAAVLALGFGQGAGGFLAYCTQFGIPMTEAEAERIVQQFRGARPRMVQWWSELHREAVAAGQLTLPSGRLLTYPDRSQNGRSVEYLRPAAFSKTAGRDRANMWHGLVVENWVQAVARDIIAHAAVRMPAKVVLMVHDEIVCVGHDEDVEPIRETMLSLPAWAEGLPIACEVTAGANYGECK